MPSLQEQVMKKLYGINIWSSFAPTKEVDGPVEGWNGNHPSLRRLAAFEGSKTIIDVGVWKGQSTINMALAMRDAGIDGCVISVDTFLGSSEHWSGEFSTFRRTQGMPDLYNTFLHNVYHAGVHDYVVPLPQTSITAAGILKSAEIRAAIVHVDAAHSYREALQDVEEYWDLLVPGGFLIGDDYKYEWPGVVQAAGEFSARKAIPLIIESPKFILQKEM